MTPQEIANAFTNLCRSGQLEEAGKQFWSDEVVSVEAMTGDMAVVKGRGAAEAKGVWWTQNHEVHSFKVEGPYVNGEQFVVRFTMEITPKGGERTLMDEVGVYTLKDGKIVEERFFYAT